MASVNLAYIILKEIIKCRNIIYRAGQTLKASDMEQQSLVKHHGHGWFSWDMLSLIPLLPSLHPSAANGAWNMADLSHTQLRDGEMMSFQHFPAIFPCGVSAPLAVQMNTFLSVILLIPSPSLSPLIHPTGRFVFPLLQLCTSDHVTWWKHGTFQRIFTAFWRSGSLKIHIVINYSHLCLSKPFLWG